MKALVLDGFAEPDQIASALRSRVKTQLEERHWSIRTYRLSEHRITWCHGEFNCWLQSPGLCMYEDTNREIADEMTRSDLVVYLCPITFGGYSYELKKTLDHQIQNLLPFFTRLNGEVHHQQRYEHTSRLMVFGVPSGADPDEESIFRALVGRNAINRNNPAYSCTVVPPNAKHDELAVLIADAFDEIDSGEVNRKFASVGLPEGLLRPDISMEQAPAREALLVVGSPRGVKSTSNAMGSYLADRLSERGVRTRTIVAASALRSKDGERTLCEAATSADLLILAYPLYIDSLCAPLTRALEVIAASRKAGTTRGGRLVAIANSGFPEASQNAISLAICRSFARQAGYAWAGGLALGCGEGIVRQESLIEGQGRTRTVRSALDLAAEAIAKGEPIPEQAVTMMAKKVIPTWLMLLFGQIGWKHQARSHGTEDRMRERPYELKMA